MLGISSLKSLIYISRSAPLLGPDDLDRIHHAAINLNALDGITGLLIYNGAHFLQLVEGASEAIDDLMTRLRNDPRHCELKIVEEHGIEARSFPDWSMELIRVSVGRFDARADTEARLPSGMSGTIRASLLTALEGISA